MVYLVSVIKYEDKACKFSGACLNQLKIMRYCDANEGFESVQYTVRMGLETTLKGYVDV